MEGFELESLNQRGESSQTAAERVHGAAKAVSGESDESTAYLLNRRLSSGERGLREIRKGEVLKWWREARSWRWMVLMVTATLSTRWILRSGFPYPSCLLLFIQVSVYLPSILLRLYNQIRKWRHIKGKGVYIKSDWKEILVECCRQAFGSTISAAGTLSNAYALMTFSNLPVLLLLPIITFIFDSLFLHAGDILTAAIRIIRTLSLRSGTREPTSPFQFHGVILIGIFSSIVIWDDYRLELRPLGFAIAASLLKSIANIILQVGKTDQGRSKGISLVPYIFASMPPLGLSLWAALKLEDLVASFHIAQTWSGFGFCGIVLPPILLLKYFQSGPNEIYRSKLGHLVSALEATTPESRDEISTTLQAAFWTLVFGVLGKGETTLITWLQSSMAMLVYLFGVGLVHTGRHVPAFLNFLAYLLRQKQRQVKLKSWPLFGFLLCSTGIWIIIMSGFTVYWTDSVAFGYRARSWIDNGEATKDNAYFPPQMRGFDIVIAHSASHPPSSVLDLVKAATAALQGQAPGLKITVYTKDKELKKVKDEDIKGDFKDSFNIIELENIGGPAASYLHHIVQTYDSLPVQTLFLTTTAKSEPARLRLYAKRLEKFTEHQGFPLPAAVPKSGFLNLGDQEICDCYSCRDSHDWEDTFGIVPSIWGATQPGNKTCDQVLLTYSNNFLTSSERIRGTKKDVWDLLFHGLLNKNIELAWTHYPERLPQMRKGEKKMGKWAEDGVYGQEDSLENPILGRTIERLWGVLLQCSSPQIAWRCPNLWRGWRRGGEKADCGCVDEGLKQFN